MQTETWPEYRARLTTEANLAQLEGEWAEFSAFLTRAYQAEVRTDWSNGVLVSNVPNASAHLNDVFERIRESVQDALQHTETYQEWEARRRLRRRDNGGL